MFSQFLGTGNDARSQRRGEPEALLLVELWILECCQALDPCKTEVRIYDYVDRWVPMLVRMFEKRLRRYRAIGYAQA